MPDFSTLMDNILLTLLGFFIIGFGIFSFFYFKLSLWFRALSSGAWINPLAVIRMHFREIDPKIVILPIITASQAGLRIKPGKLESHLLSGGNVEQLVKTLIIVNKASIPLTFDRAAAIDLAGINVLERVQNYVTPKVIKTPNVTAMAKDGIQLTAIARVTVQTNFERLLSGAGEETILAMVGEGIVAEIGSAISHKNVQGEPDRISGRILSDLKRPEVEKKLAFDIVSVDIADIDVGKNIGAGHEIETAEAETKVARSKAEERRALAFAEEQEMKVEVLRKRAMLIESDSKVPLAIAAGIEAGKVNLMDYYRMKNIVADTEMRDMIASLGKDQQKKNTDEDE